MTEEYSETSGFDIKVTKNCTLVRYDRVIYVWDSVNQ